MDKRNLEMAASLVDPTYISQGEQSLRQRSKLLRTMLSSRSLPEEGWDEMDLERVLLELSEMDSNRFGGCVGLGEREGRVFSGIVRRRHFGFAHGIGRSGDVAAIQPKAAGSSLLNRLTGRLALDAVRTLGVSAAKAALVLPVATGMSMTLTLLCLRSHRSDARYVVWPRIDQKACFKAIQTAGLLPVIVPLSPAAPEAGDDAAATAGTTVVTEATPVCELQCRVDDIEAAISRLPRGAADVVCVVSTTSCFAPRVPDDVVGIATLCGRLGVPHVVNNAYGLQSSRTCARLNEAMAGATTFADAVPVAPPVAGAAASSAATAPAKRVDVVISSTDKNFGVPVGGAVLVAPSTLALKAVAETYPGRASASPMLDLFVTLVTVGKRRLLEGRALRKRAHAALRRALVVWAAKHGEIVIGSAGEPLDRSAHNPISIAVTLGAICGGHDGDESSGAGASHRTPGAALKRATLFGSVLFARGVSGCRVVAPGASKVIGGVEFRGWGAQCNDYPVPYFTAAAALGLRAGDVDTFVAKLDVAVRDYKKLLRKQTVVAGEAK